MNFSIADFDSVVATGRGRCDSCIVPLRLQALIVEAYTRGECETSEDMIKIAESTCGNCLDESMVTTYEDSRAIWLLLEAKPEQQKRKRRASAR